MPAYDLAGVEDNQNSFQKNAGRENCAKGEWQEKNGGVNVESSRISTKQSVSTICFPRQRMLHQNHQLGSDVFGYLRIVSF